MASDDGETGQRIKRRTVLKAAGIAVVGGVGAVGPASAHRMQFFGCSEVCTDTDGNFAVVSVDGGYEGRELAAAAGRDDVAWTHDNTYCYEAAADEAIVGFVEEDVYRGDERADDGCTLCLNPNDCADEHYDDPQEIVDDLDEDDVGVCVGKLSVGDCDITGAPADEDGGGDGSEDEDGGGAWPMTEFDARRTNFNPDASGISGEPTVDWEYDLPATENRGFDHSAAVAAGGSVYVAETTGAPGVRLLSLDATDGSVEWEATYDRGERIYTRAVHDGVVYVHLWHNPPENVDMGDVVAIDAADGSELWRTTITGYDVLLDDLVVSDGVYTVNSGGGAHVRKLDRESGEQQWETSFSFYPYIHLAVTHGRVYVVASDITALDADSGEIAWQVESGTPDPQSLIAGEEAIYVYYGGGGPNTLRRFDAETGETEWTRDQPERFQTQVLADGLLYSGGADEVQVVDAETGDLAETFDEGLIPEAATEDTLYGFADGSTGAPLKALDRDTGELRWQIDDASHAGWTGEWIAGDILALDETVYAPGADGDALVRLTGDEE
ncbi:outer membrane protein assembly factor BamB family protein [Halosimplex sp. J119]